ncbi:hypothetical protein TSMEX_005884 [Taenia solium]|eukprot:TsM_000786100 transcript=TsM_000786100 gene=TsM_000786100
MTLRESLSDPRAAMPNMASVMLPPSHIPTDFPVQFGVNSAATPHWNPMNAISRHIGWSVQSKGSKQLSSIRGAVTLPTVSTGQGELLPQPTLCQPNLVALTPAVEHCNVQPTPPPRETPTAALAEQASSIPDDPSQPALLLEQMDEYEETIAPKCPSPATSRFRVIRLPESERATNWGLYPDSTEDKAMDSASAATSSEVPTAVPAGIPTTEATPTSASGHTPINQTQPKPTVVRRQTIHHQRLHSPIVESKPDVGMQQRVSRCISS